MTTTTLTNETRIARIGRLTVVEILGGPDGAEWEIRDADGEMVSDGYNTWREAIKDARVIEEWASYEEQEAVD